MRRRICVLILSCLLCSASVSHADQGGLEYAELEADLIAVPQNLLGLAHTPEVQSELKFDDSQLKEFEAELRVIDIVWWPARIQPAEQQRKIVAGLETKLVEAVERLRGKSAVERLRQIELQSQSSRVVLRPEVSKYLRLDGPQSKKLKELFAETDELGKDLKPDDAKRVQQLATAQKNEPSKALAICCRSKWTNCDAPLENRLIQRSSNVFTRSHPSCLILCIGRTISDLN